MKQIDRKTQLSLVTAQVLATDAGLFGTDAITDVAEGASSALIAVEKEAYTTDYDDIDFHEILPIINLNDPLASAFQFSFVKSAGKAELAKAIGDISWVDSFIGTKNVPLHDGNVGYKFGHKELGQAGRMGVALDSTKATESMNMALRLAQDIAYNGDAERGITGFFNNPDVLNIGVSGGIAWASKTAEEMLTDFNNLCGTAYATSKQVEFKPNSDTNRVLLPTALWTLISGKVYSALTGETVLDYIVKSSPYITKKEHVRASIHLTDGTIRIYQYDKRKVAFYWGVMPRFLAPQPQNLLLSVAGSYSIGGTVLRRPLSVYDMIGA